MRLFIAEKPSLGRAIAEALPGPHKRTRESIECGDNDVVTWCFGHVLAPVRPEDYNPSWRVWRLEDLPLAPREWRLQVSAPGPIAAIRKLLARASRVVHAGDPDREGQLLVDEVLTFLGYKGPVDRLLVSDTTLPAVRRQLEAIEPNAKYRRLSDSALARQRADWVYGMTMTRLYTILGQRGGYRGLLSVGRVQTPLLGLIVRRDRAIETFQPVAYYALSATFKTDGGEVVRARWVPGPSAAPHLDDDKRLLSREFAEAVRWRTDGAEGKVVAASRETKTEAPPLPYSLADLQIDAARRLDLSAKEVLDACQRLYEAHRLTTYPRSDCSHLPEGQHADAPAVLEAVAKRAPALAPLVARADRALRSRAWNDKKVTAHHAIVPTANTAARVDLTPLERSVYELVARRYVSQFHPPMEYLQTKLEIQLGDERFVAAGRQIAVPGWREVAPDTSGDPSPDGREGEECDPSAASGGHADDGDGMRGGGEAHPTAEALQ